MNDFLREFLKSTQNKILALSLVIFGTAFWISGLFITGPISEKISSLQTRRDLEKQKKELVRTLVEFEKSLSKRGERLLDKQDPAWVIEAVNRFAQGSGMPLTAVTPQASERQSRFIRMPVLVESRCTWLELGKFSSRLESASKFMKFDRISLGRIQDAHAQDSTIQASLWVSTFLPVRE